MTKSSAPMAAAVETVAFALIGAAVEVPRCLPRVLGQQKAKVEQQLTLARFLGKMAVTQAQSELRRRIAAAQTPAPGTATSVAAPSPTPRESPVTLQETVASPPVADLPIEQYDELSASQVISRLSNLDASELELVYDYESAHRRRRTVLGRLDQLRLASS